MLSEQLLKGGGSALLQGMDSLDQAEDVGSHNEEVAKASGTGIPVGVERSTRNEHARFGSSFDVLVANLHAQSAFEHVPGLVVVMVDVTGGRLVAEDLRDRWHPATLR